MEERDFLQLAQNAGFTAALCKTVQIPVEHAFRRYCEENLCGQYGKNHGCPPACGAPQDMEAHLRKYRSALVLQTAWPITDYTDHKAIVAAKIAHNASSVRLLAELEAAGHRGAVVGCSGCTVCEECSLLQGEPCRLPEQRYACMSAYCVHVLELAKLCNLRYDCEDGNLRMFGMILFD